MIELEFEPWSFILYSYIFIAMMLYYVMDDAAFLKNYSGFSMLTE